MKGKVIKRAFSNGIGHLNMKFVLCNVKKVNISLITFIRQGNFYYLYF